MGTGTMSLVEVIGAVGLSAPKFMGPVEVATKKLSSEPGVKLLPSMVKFEPTRIGLAMLVMTGCPGGGVGVGAGTVGPGVTITHSAGIVGVAEGVALGVGDGVGVLLGVKVGMKVGGPMTLKPVVALDERCVKSPAKLAASWIIPT